MRRRGVLDSDLDSGLRRSVLGVVVLLVACAVVQLVAAVLLHEPLGRVLLVLAVVTPLTLAVGLLAARRAARRR